MVGVNRDFYDGLFDTGLALKTSVPQATRYRAIIEHLPQDARTILDAGCGDGALLSLLSGREWVAGVDFSISALRLATGIVACSRIDRLCFADRSFDLVVAGEVLEHLSGPLLQEAVREMARVARRYCVVSVPNRERLRFSHVLCPSCHSSFHPDGHLQSFDPERLVALIPGFAPLRVVEIGSDRHEFPAWLIALRRALRGPWPLPPGMACPVCGHSAEGRYRVASGERLASRRTVSFLARKRPSWLLAVYARRESPGIR